MLSANANNLKIENVAYDQAAGNLTFDISWENSWNLNNDYHDAVWVFVKYKSVNINDWRPLAIDDGNGNIASITGGGLQFSPKGIGFLVRSNAVSVGQVDIATTTVTVSGFSLVGINPSFKVFGVEMVNVPAGDFYLGDDSGLVDTFESSSSQSPMTVTDTTTQFYVSGGSGPINLRQEFPTGVDAFYCMKYEITQGQMVSFLNTINYDVQSGLNAVNGKEGFKYPFTSSNDVVDRMGIAIEQAGNSLGLPITFGMDLNNNGVFNEIGDGASLACNYLFVIDVFKYFDWAGLRPMSELEYEKACRGLLPAIANEYASGVNSRGVTAITIENAGTSNETSSGTNMNLSNGFGPLRVGFSATGSTNRVTSGNSFYGIANLSDNVQELTMKASSSSFFSGNFHGDGVGDQILPLGSVVGLGGVIIWDTRIIYRGASYTLDPDNRHLGTISNRVGSPETKGYQGARGVVSF